MANVKGGAIHGQIDRLFQNGTITGLTDAELLERYLTRGDEVAFEALVRLHGPMVLGLCRRMLRDRQDVEDAFQATFLILVRKAPAIRDRALLGNWLYGVAYRVAVRARQKAAKRDAGKQPAERLDEVPDAASSPSDIADWMPILDEELARLPEKYRSTLVLCYINGRTHEQSAGQLGIPVGTVRSRLARGRDLLKRRLERRGVAPSAIAVALGGSPSAMNLLETVPASLLSETLASACRFLSVSSTTTAATTATISAISLAQGAITSMFLSQMKIAVFGILATGAVVSGAAWAVSSSSGSARREAAPSDPPKAIAADSQPAKAQDDAKPDPDRDIADKPAPTQLSLLDGGDRSTPRTIAQGPIHELEAQLDIAIRRYLGRQSLHQQKSISQEAFDDARGKVELVKAQLKDVIESLEEEHVRLELEFVKAQAETRIQAAKVKIASFKPARNERLNSRVKGAVSEEDLARDEADLELAKAQLESSQADTNAAKEKLLLVGRRIDAAKAVLKKAKAIEPAVPDAKPSPAPAPAR